MARNKPQPRSGKNFRDVQFSRPTFDIPAETQRSIVAILFIFIAIFGFFSLLNNGGTLGVYYNSFLTMAFGDLRWLAMILLILIGYKLLRPSERPLTFSNYFGLFVFTFAFSGLVHIIAGRYDLTGLAAAGQGGGYVGLTLSYVFMELLAFWASLFLLLAITLIGLFLLFNISFADFAASWLHVQSWFAQINDALMGARVRRAQRAKEREQMEEPVAPVVMVSEPIKPAVVMPKKGSDDAEDIGPIATNPAELSELDKSVLKFRTLKIDIPLELLTGKSGIPNGGDLATNKILIQKTFENFGIMVEMGDVQVGPTVTQYTFKPAEGVKLTRITALADNLALALAAHPIRIEAPIPGRSLVGIEVPNATKAAVPLKDILSSDTFKTRPSNLMIALGKDVMGKPWLADIKSMPHLLIAGSTGSGKSVCINSIILSLLYQNGPADLKFIMVDPKRVELPIYNGIPHLLTPVITDVKKTVNALRWAISEMERRFETLAAVHKRNIESYNAEATDKLPYIVFIIDELADLMATASAEVEAAIIRLAQMARAVGIHLVLATQRPSVDVITGLIKANITCRIAFAVASLVDSRTILDQAGAEKLLGRGDMLYVSADLGKPKRLQGAFMADSEIAAVTDYLKKQADPVYIEEVTERQGAAGGDFAGGDEDGDGDPLLVEAKEVILQAKKASASLLQRRLSVGYARAARILDLLEQQGFIGPGQGAKPREILMAGRPTQVTLDSIPDEVPSTDSANHYDVEADLGVTVDRDDRGPDATT